MKFTLNYRLPLSGACVDFGYDNAQQNNQHLPTNVDERVCFTNIQLIWTWTTTIWFALLYYFEADVTFSHVSSKRNIRTYIYTNTNPIKSNLITPWNVLALIFHACAMLAP